MKSVAIDAWKVTCPKCHQDWFELDEAPLKQCPHCFTTNIYSEEEPKNVGVYVYIDPLTGAVDAEVA